MSIVSECTENSSSGGCGCENEESSELASASSYCSSTGFYRLVDRGPGPRRVRDVQITRADASYSVFTRVEPVIGAEDLDADVSEIQWSVGELSEQMTACTDLSGVCWTAPWRGEVETALTCVSDSEPMRSAHTHTHTRLPGLPDVIYIMEQGHRQHLPCQTSSWDVQRGLSLLGATPQAIPPLPLELNSLDL
ncbi:hypothetical protein F2P79_003478 [Pimephales promelas]|nr:hypothetical protein F2P79_003478 [Pimephales promelas]